MQATIYLQTDGVPTRAITIEAEPVRIEDRMWWVHHTIVSGEEDIDSWTVTEPTTGAAVVDFCSSRNEAVEDATRKLRAAGPEKLAAAIAKARAKLEAQGLERVPELEAQPGHHKEE